MHTCVHIHVCVCVYARGCLYAWSERERAENTWNIDFCMK